MTDIPQSISTATMRIGSVELVVHQLDNGQRIIEADSMNALFAAMEDGTLEISPDDAMELAKVVMP